MSPLQPWRHQHHLLPCSGCPARMAAGLELASPGMPQEAWADPSAPQVVSHPLGSLPVPCSPAWALCCFGFAPCRVKMGISPCQSRAGGARFPPSPAGAQCDLSPIRVLPFHSAWDRVFQDVGWAGDFCHCFVCYLDQMNHIPRAQLYLGKPSRAGRAADMTTGDIVKWLSW